MIRVTVELLPKGDKTKPVHLGTVNIANDLVTSLATNGSRGSYNVTVISKSGRVSRLAEVKDYARNSRPVFDLLAEALAAAGYKVQKK